MAATDLTDLAHVGPWLKMTSAQWNADPVLPDLISDCSQAFRQYVQRDIVLMQYVERRDGNGKQRLVFGNYPVSAVSSVVVDNYALAASSDGVKPGYVFDQYTLSIIGWPAGTGIGELNPYTLTIGSFSKGFGNVFLTYTAGYQFIPGDIRRAVTMWVAHLYRGIEHTGEKSHHFEQGQATLYDVGEMPDFVEKVAERYRRRGMAGDAMGTVISSTPVIVQPPPPPGGTAVNYHLVAASGVNANVIKNLPGTVFGWDVLNNTTYPVYIKLFDKATAPVPGTDQPIRTIGVQAGEKADFNPLVGISFVSGIGIAIVKGIADNDSTPVAAGDCVVDVTYI